MKGIHGSLVAVLMVLVAVALVGFVFAFFLGFLGTASNKAVLVNGQSSCVNGLASIAVTNAGNADLQPSEVQVDRISCTASGSGPCGSPSFTPLTTPIPPQGTGKWTDDCGDQHVCIYDVIVSGVTYTTRANCF